MNQRPTQNKFYYLLDALESAGRQHDPAAHLYGPKRRAVLDHVSNLERQRDELAEALVKVKTVAVKAMAAANNDDGLDECMEATALLAKIDRDRQ